jgi:hypothetical protein
MAVGFVMAATWGPIEVAAGPLQTNYWRIPFDGAPHIVATSCLSEVSIGGHDGRSGVAVATFKRFERLDDSGRTQEIELTEVSSILEVERCVSITIALDLQDAVAMGGWSFYWLP